MTATYRTIAVGGTAVDDTDITATIVPAIGDLLIVFILEVGPFNGGAEGFHVITDDNVPQGIGFEIATKWVRFEQANFDIGDNSRVTAWVRGSLMINTNSTILTFTRAFEPLYAQHMAVVAVSGMQTAGVEAIRQSAEISGVAGVATVPFDAVALTTNLILTALGSFTNPPGLTAPSGFTVRSNAGQTQPIGLNVASRDNGFTGPNVTWATNPLTNWAGIVVELDGNAGAGAYQDLSSRGFIIAQSGTPAVVQAQAEVVDETPPDVTPPYITIISPTPGATIGQSTLLVFRYTDESGLRRPMPMVKFRQPDNTYKYELIHDGENFTPDYIGTKTVISALSCEFSVMRRGGWGATLLYVGNSPTLVPFGTDTGGNETA